MTIWNSSDDRPRVILDRIFTQSITDLTWTPDGHTLLACSTDGSIAVFKVQSLCPTITTIEALDHDTADEVLCSLALLSALIITWEAESKLPFVQSHMLSQAL